MGDCQSLISANLDRGQQGVSPSARSGQTSDSGHPLLRPPPFTTSPSHLPLPPALLPSPPPSPPWPPRWSSPSLPTTQPNHPTTPTLGSPPAQVHSLCKMCPSQPRVSIQKPGQTSAGVESSCATVSVILHVVIGATQTAVKSIMFSTASVLGERRSAC
jgi:hypothetical protein